jgi:hypothetical protein
MRFVKLGEGSDCISVEAVRGKDKILDDLFQYRGWWCSTGRSDYATGNTERFFRSFEEFKQARTEITIASNSGMSSILQGNSDRRSESTHCYIWTATHLYTALVQQAGSESTDAKKRGQTGSLVPGSRRRGPEVQQEMRHGCGELKILRV